MSRQQRGVEAKIFNVFVAFVLPPSGLIWHNPYGVVNSQDNSTRCHAFETPVLDGRANATNSC